MKVIVIIPAAGLGTRMAPAGKKGVPSKQFFEINGSPIDVDKGGPFRFYIPNAAECAIAEVDECANVKYLDRIELTVGPGKDTRPKTKRAHKELHEQ